MTHLIRRDAEQLASSPLPTYSGSFRWEDSLGARVGRRRPAVSRRAKYVEASQYAGEVASELAPELDAALTAAFL